MQNRAATISKCKMINLDDVTNENKRKNNSKVPYIPGHPYRILKIGGSGSGKANTLSILINHQPDIDKMYPYTKELFEAKYQYLIKKCELSNIPMICKMFIKILKNTIQQKM